ncbi:MAG: TIGR00730 family Rossman fold protein [Patescibacteria group bacterium]
MPTKKSKPKATKLKRKVTVEITDTGAKRYMHWLCAPGNKCVPTTGPSFTDNYNWRIFRIMAEFIEGFEFLSKLKKEVTIFGSARIMQNNPYYKLAYELGKRLGEEGYTVITGGGPGIMEAANWGASEGGGESVGLDIELATEQRRNQFVTKSIGFHYFFTRKVMLSASSQAYIFFPGGFGTLDEMAEMVLLIQTGKIPSDVPAILVGKKFWQPMLDWMQKTMLEDERFIEKDDLKLLHIVDTAEEAMHIIKKTHERAFG